MRHSEVGRAVHTGPHLGDTQETVGQTVGETGKGEAASREASRQGRQSPSRRQLTAPLPGRLGGPRLQNPDGMRGRAGGPGEAVATASAGRTAPGRRPGSSAPFCTSPCVGPAWGTVPGDVNLTCSMHVPGHDPKPTQAVAVRNVKKKKNRQRWVSTRGQSDSRFCKKTKSPRK